MTAERPPLSSLRTAILTSAAMLAFAANSVLCRKALEHRLIDLASFTLVRLATGALVLFVIVKLRRGKPPAPGARNWISAAMLFLYAIGFSFAYTKLSAGTGALLLFGLVQFTMLVTAIASGERPPVSEWAGLTAAGAGLVWLLLPGLTAPPLPAAMLMAGAGIAWGVYSLRGRRSADALQDTAANFLRGVPFALIASLLLFRSARISPAGVGWAALSGGVTSGLGYVIWYAALRGLTPTRAAIVQLSVPVLAGVGGVALLGEPVTWRLLTSGALILGGIALAVLSRFRSQSR